MSTAFIRRFRRDLTVLLLPHRQTPRTSASPYVVRQIAKGASGNDDLYVPSKALPEDPRQSSVFNFCLKSPAGQRSANATSPASFAGIAPPMPDGEEYDSDTEAERQAAWAEYYQLMGLKQAAVNIDSGAGEAGHAHLGHGLDTGDYLEE